MPLNEERDGSETIVGDREADHHVDSGSCGARAVVRRRGGG